MTCHSYPKPPKTIMSKQTAHHNLLWIPCQHVAVAYITMFLCPKSSEISGNCFMPICLPQQRLAPVNGLPTPGDPLLRESPGWWVRLQSVGHRHRTCSLVLVAESLKNVRKLFHAYMSTPAMPGPCEWAPMFLCLKTLKALGNCFMSTCLPTWCRGGREQTQNVGQVRLSVNKIQQ